MPTLYEMIWPSTEWIVDICEGGLEFSFLSQGLVGWKRVIYYEMAFNLQQDSWCIVPCPFSTTFESYALGYNASSDPQSAGFQCNL